MNTYLTKLVFRVISGNGNHTPQFDEQTRIIHAHNPHEAYSRANEIGYAEESCFINHKQEIVKWVFIAVAEIVCPADYEDTHQLCSHTSEPANANAYIAQLREKSIAAASQQTPTTFAKTSFN